MGDVYADLWRRPELDPSYGQTALATYQELLNRYANSSAAARAQERINELHERFAYKEYRAGLFYFKLKAYDSAILYLKDVVATYPARGHRSRRAAQAGRGVPAAGLPGGRAGDLRLPPALPPHRGARRDPVPCRHGRGLIGRMVGLFGGSFDPVHHGHLIVGQVAAEMLGLDSLRFVPAREQPFKRGRPRGASPEHRAAMLDLAVARRPGLEVERAELDRPGPSYTVDTLRALRARRARTSS